MPKQKEKKDMPAQAGKKNLSAKRQEKDSSELPTWMECTWRRVPCNKKDCGICGQVAKTKGRKKEVEEDADSGVVLEDMANTLQEGIEALQEIAQEEGIEIDLKDVKIPPRPTTFPLYREINNWREHIFDLADEADMTGELWTETADAADLFWYANIISAKSYRQLANRWHLEEHDGYGDFDHAYTKRVLKECLRITRNGLGRLAYLSTEQKGELILALSRLGGIEKKILAI